MKQLKAVKLPKGVTQEFVDGIQSMTIDQLKSQIVLLQVQNQENEAFKEAVEYMTSEEEYNAAKERWALVAGPVKEVTLSVKNRTKMVVDRLKEKGGA